MTRQNILILTDTKSKENKSQEEDDWCFEGRFLDCPPRGLLRGRGCFQRGSGGASVLLCVASLSPLCSLLLQGPFTAGKAACASWQPRNPREPGEGPVGAECSRESERCPRLGPLVSVSVNVDLASCVSQLAVIQVRILSSHRDWRLRPYPS